MSINVMISLGIMILIFLFVESLFWFSSIEEEGFLFHDNFWSGWFAFKIIILGVLFIAMIITGFCDSDFVRYIWIPVLLISESLIIPCLKFKKNIWKNGK